MRPLLICLLWVGTMSAEHSTCLRGGRILREHTLRNEELWVCEGRIVEARDHADEIIDVDGAIIAPGYIDIQVNGGFGIDVSLEPERLPELAARLPEFGVTAFLPTVITSPATSYANILKSLASASVDYGATPLGTHLEGPCLSPQRSGCHPKECLSKDMPELDGVSLVTLAPECVDQELVPELVAQGVRVAAGHSMATYEQMKQAEQAGLSLVTHLGNATRPFEQREPGIYGAAFLSDKLYASVIADGVHLHTATLQLFIRLLGERLILVSDAMPSLGLGDGIYRFGELDVEVRGTRAQLQGTECLAGTVCPLDACVRNLVAAGSSIVNALESASLRPAQLLGLAPRKGSLELGADADFLILDSELNIEECWIGGRRYEGVRA